MTPNLDQSPPGDRRTADLAQSPGGSGTTVLSAMDWSAAASRYFDALRSGERSVATTTALGLLVRGASAERIIGDVLARSQAQVGDAWEQDSWSISGEHIATAITESVLEVLTHEALRAQDAPVPGSRGRAVVVCADGEWHTLPALMAAAVLRLRGVRVTFVGPSVPAEDLVEHLLDDGTSVVVMACTAPMNLAGAWRSIRLLRSRGMTVVCGGRGFGAEGRWSWPLGADQWASDFTVGADRVLMVNDGPRRALREPAVDAEAARELDVLGREHHDLVLAAVRSAARRLPALVATDQARVAARERIDSALRIVASATVVADPSVATEHARWLEGTLAARSQPLEWAIVTFEAILDVLPHDLTRSRAMALTGCAACGRGDQAQLAAAVGLPGSGSVEVMARRSLGTGAPYVGERRQMGAHDPSTSRAGDRIDGEARFRSLAEHASDVVCETDADGVITWVSRSIALVLGHDADALVGTRLHDLLHPDDVPAAVEVRVTAISTGGTAVVDLRFLTADGQERWMSVSVHPIGSDGAVSGLVVGLRDITELVVARTLAAKALEQYKALAENAADVVWRLDDAGIIEWVSPSVETLLGWAPDRLIGRDVLELAEPTDAARIHAERARIRAGESDGFRTRVRTAQGGHRWVSGTARPTNDENGNPTGRVVAWRLIDAEVAAEQAVRRRT